MNGEIVSNRICHDKEVRRLQLLHLKQLKSIHSRKTKINKPKVTDMGHLKKNFKKTQLQIEIQKKINRENTLLLERMAAISTQMPKVGVRKNAVVNAKVGRNSVARSKELKRIEEENRKLANRLLQSQPIYNHKDWERSSSVLESYAKVHHSKAKKQPYPLEMALKNGSILQPSSPTHKKTTATFGQKNREIKQPENAKDGEIRDAVVPSTKKGGKNIVAHQKEKIKSTLQPVLANREESSAKIAAKQKAAMERLSGSGSNKKTTNESLPIPKQNSESKEKPKSESTKDQEKSFLKQSDDELKALEREPEDATEVLATVEESIAKTAVVTDIEESESNIVQMITEPACDPANDHELIKPTCTPVEDIELNPDVSIQPTASESADVNTSDVAQPTSRDTAEDAIANAQETTTADIRQTESVEATIEPQDISETTDHDSSEDNVKPVVPEPLEAADDGSAEETKVNVKPVVPEASEVVDNDSVEETKDNVKSVVPEPFEIADDDSTEETKDNVKQVVSDPSEAVDDDPVEKTEANVKPVVPEATESAVTDTQNEALDVQDVAEDVIQPVDTEPNRIEIIPDVSEPEDNTRRR